jgi:hypothetical protein
MILAGVALFLAAPLSADPLDQQLLEDAPKAAAPSKPSTPLPPTGEQPAPATPRQNPDQTLDTRHPLTRIAGKMELVERRLTSEFNSTILGLQQEIVADLDRLLSPGDPKSAGAPKEDNSKQEPAKQDQGKQTPSNKQPPGKQAGQGPEAPNGSGTGEGNNELRKPTPRELMEKTWGNLPARERERVFEAAGESFLPKYARSLRLYFERLAEEDTGK